MSVPLSGLSFLSEKSLRHKEVRQSCNDLLNFHTQLAKIATGTKQEKNGAVLDTFGAFLEQFGVVLDNNGVITDKDGSNNKTKNSLPIPENAENTESPLLAPPKTPAP